MRYNFRIKHNEKYNIDLVEMKCLKCGYEEEIELDILLELFNPHKEENPIITCPHCEEESFTPKDIYDQIKGNFVYKPTKKKG